MIEEGMSYILYTMIVTMNYWIRRAELQKILTKNLFEQSSLLEPVLLQISQ